MSIIDMVNGRLCETLPVEEIEQIRNESYNKALSELREKMDALWSAYARNPDNIPKPDFMSAYTLIIIMEEHNNDSQI